MLKEKKFIQVVHVHPSKKFVRFLNKSTHYVKSF